MVGIVYTARDMEYERDDLLKIIYDPNPPFGPDCQDDTQYIQDCVDQGIQPEPGFYRITKLIEVAPPVFEHKLKEVS